MAPMGKALFVLGVVIAGLGLLLWTFSSVPFVGKLPGDVYIRRDNFSFYFPITTCILISIIASVVFALLRRW